jgi:hypothetical protein
MTNRQFHLTKFFHISFATIKKESIIKTVKSKKSLFSTLKSNPQNIILNRGIFSQNFILFNF